MNLDQQRLSEHTMFFGTPIRLLRPLHSLLKDPFAFSAGSSISGRLREILGQRTDYNSLVALGRLYDKSRMHIQDKLIHLRPLLEKSLSAKVPTSTDLRICRTELAGKSVQFFGMDAAQYLGTVSVQCQMDRLYDLMGLHVSGTENALEHADAADAIQLLMLNEALALCIAGIASVNQYGDNFDISVNGPVAQDVLRATWFARTADQGSRIATMLLARDLAKSGATTVQQLEPLIVKILDQDLSIPWYQLSDQGRALNSIRCIYDAVGLIAILMVADFQRKPINMTKDGLRKHDLDFGTVASLVGRQSQALVTDQFVSRHGTTLKIHVDNVSKGLRTYFRALENEFGECDLLRELVGGKFFEEIYIRQRIELGPDYKPRYRIVEGFTREKVVGKIENESDVEFIIQDLQQRHYYFIQAKHALLGEKAFFNSVVEAIQKDIGHGIHQLREAKQLLETQQLDGTLNARGIGDATPENSSFILLHNIAQFDFQSTEDNISLYDWTTFRNLLKDAECAYGSSNASIKNVRLSSPLVVDHPMRVISRLLTEHPAYGYMHKDGWTAERATTSYTILGKTLRVIGLGI